MEQESMVEIREMPSQELLQEYLQGMFSKVTVIFNVDEGVFQRVGERVEV